MKKQILKIFAAVMTLMIVICSFPLTFSAADTDIKGNYNFTVTNPYKDVNWDTWDSYKGATHVHTTRSDGDVQVDAMIENYYALDYDLLALTDHGTVNYGWTNKQTRLTVFGYQFFVHGNVDVLKADRYNAITSGVGRGGRGMTEVPYGIELNGASTSKCHVNSYFADCGHGDLEITTSWPRTAVEKSEKAGGITHINHVGEWSGGKDDIGVYDAKFISDFADIFATYKSCVGMELVNTSDSRTKNDRYLYDETLKLLAPNGRNVFGFCEDDSHDEGDCGKNAQYYMMPSNTVQNIRTSMETGAFFACSKNSKNADELGDGFLPNGDFPMVNSLNIEESEDRINFDTYKATKARIVADGKLLDTIELNGDDSETVSFDLNKYEDSINSYVRIYFTGPGGICYVQPFLLTKTQTTGTAQVICCDENGNELDKQEIGYSFGENLSVSHKQIKGYTYSGRFERFTDNGTVKQTEASATGDTITANKADYTWKFYYTANNYNISFTNTFSDFTPDSLPTATYAQQYKLPSAVPTRSGYIFKCWSLNSTECYQNTLINWNVAEDASFSAVWESVILPADESTVVLNEDSNYIYGFYESPTYNSLLDSVETKEDYNVTCTPNSNGGYGTGTVFSVTDGNSNEVIKYTVVVFGDVDGDGKADGNDSFIVNLLANGILTREQVGDTVYFAADCNHDSVVDFLDSELLEKAGLLSENVEQTLPENQNINELISDEQIAENNTAVIENNDTEISTENTIISLIKSIGTFILSVFNYIIGLFA